MIEFRGSNIDTAKWVLAARRGLTSERPELVRRVLSAYRDAIEIIRRNPADAITAYADQINAESTCVQENRNAIRYGINLDWSLLASLRQKFEWAVQAGYCGDNPAPEIPPRVDARALDTIVPFAVRIPHTDRER